eukprot:496801-Amphidinium_carterae.1
MTQSMSKNCASGIIRVVISCTTHVQKVGFADSLSYGLSLAVVRNKDDYMRGKLDRTEVGQVRTWLTALEMYQQDARYELQTQQVGAATKIEMASSAGFKVSAGSIVLVAMIQKSQQIHHVCGQIPRAFTTTCKWRVCES